MRLQNERTQVPNDPSLAECASAQQRAQALQPAGGMFCGGSPQNCAHERCQRRSQAEDCTQRISASSAWCTHRRKEARLDDRRLAHGVAIRDNDSGGASGFAGDRLICRLVTTRAEVHKTASGSAVLLAYGNTCRDARRTREHVRRDRERVRHANWHRAGSGAPRNTEAGDRGDVVLEHLAQALRVQQAADK
jgi:hypothetical protein